MKSVGKWVKRALCLALTLAVLLPCGGILYANAASSISVTSAITGEQLYAGNDLQEAFDAAERGCIVSVSRYVTLSSNAVLDVEVMLSGYSYIKFGDYKIQLTGEGAIFVDTRMRTKYIGALYSYSSVEMVEENGGYVYYLLTQAPSFEGKQPSVKVAGNLLGAKLDEAAGILWLDAATGGITSDKMSELITMTADNADAVQYSFNGANVTGGKTYVSNDCTMVCSAVNHDYGATVTKSYTIILLGDVNGNGKIDAADASLIACHASGTKSLTGNALVAADANLDGVVSAEDAWLICEKYVKGSTYSSPL